MRGVFPSLVSFPGHRGAYLLTREVDGEVEFLAVTFWNNIESVKRFTGENSELAVVEPEARAVLSDFDTFVRHYEIVNVASCGISSPYQTTENGHV